MNFETMLVLLENGKKVRRASWKKGEYIKKSGEYIITDTNAMFLISKNNAFFTLDDIYANDWEKVRFTKKIRLRFLTNEQLKKYCNERKCENCFFFKLNCFTWLKNKNTLNDDFLNQEVEIESDGD